MVVLRSDIRGNNIDLLTPKDIEEISNRFKEMDLDGNGFITREEATTYYKKKRQKLLDLRIESTNKIIELQPSRKKELTSQLQHAKKIASEGLKIEIDYLFSRDSNADGKVSCNCT